MEVEDENDGSGAAAASFVAGGDGGGARPADDGAANDMHDLFGEESDGDDDAMDTQQLTTEGLFGDADDDDEAGDVAATAATASASGGGASPVGSASSRASSSSTSHAAALLLPRVPRPPFTLGSDAKHHIDVLRLPKTISVSNRAYNPATYDEAAEDAGLAVGGRLGAREALLRFRFKRDAAGHLVKDAAGLPVRESNAQFVQWDDGSITLHVGREVFAAASAPAEGDRSTLFARVTATTGKAARRETVLEAQGPIASRMLLRTLDGVASTAAGLSAGGPDTAAAAAAGAGSSSRASRCPHPIR